MKACLRPSLSAGRAGDWWFAVNKMGESLRWQLNYMLFWRCLWRFDLFYWLRVHAHPQDPRSERLHQGNWSPRIHKCMRVCVHLLMALRPCLSARSSGRVMWCNCLPITADSRIIHLRDLHARKYVTPVCTGFLDCCIIVASGLVHGLSKTHIDSLKKSAIVFGLGHVVVYEYLLLFLWQLLGRFLGDRKTISRQLNFKFRWSFVFTVKNTAPSYGNTHVFFEFMKHTLFETSLPWQSRQPCPRLFTRARK